MADTQAEGLLDDLDEVCPRYHEAVELVGKRWTGAILRMLMCGPHRFSELVDCIPDISDRLLSQRLKELEREDLAERVVHPETPVRVEYHLTEKGQALEPALAALEEWAHDWLPSEAGGD